ncbi:uncharacterized protein LOC111394957 isoform X1 [Olea europaea var. sylvestris]|uniref:uncharacterized protein LOC111394957 isoform X1 n=1 Tax=Olea europaea var. sylvestris TaxID=158386 RepID=UPI000C1D12D5|nr:uncharacterized protein LOC111394957 isoform X1 [Olea europaea var. sylvestris]
MNYVFANSECSSGCESGWTLYLEHSSSSFSQYSLAKKVKVSDEEEENEDLSMVSDASSGPPHFHEEDEFYRAPVDPTLSKINRPNMKKKVKENPRRQVQEQPSLLDDTASSPIFDYSEKNFSLPNGQAFVGNALEYSQGYSTTQFEGRSTYQENYDLFQSSLYANQQQKNQWSEGKEDLTA